MRAAGAEADLLRLQRAGDVEPVGVGEHRLVAIGRVVPQHHLLAGLDLGVVQHRVFGDRAPEVDDRCRATNDLVDRRLDVTRR